VRVYLDDDIASGLLRSLLVKGGYDAQLPSDVGLRGKDDSVHLTHAIRDSRTLVSRNYGDFENLHDLIGAARGNHPGILVVRKDNDPRRDLDAHGVVRAIGKLLAAGVPIADQYIVLNHWR
jgi:hypothetical protein